MSEKKFVVVHHLEQLSPEALTQYLRDVSAYIGIDPDLNGLETIWLDNESGMGRTLVPYAKRGTAEILRNVYKINVEELTNTMVKGSIVFTAAGRSAVSGRIERAIGSKYIEGLVGKALDNAIMTASTRALRRLTMQFTTLGILDESEIVDIVGQNPASSAQLAGSPVVIPPQPQVPVNNAPGKEMTSSQVVGTVLRDFEAAASAAARVADGPTLPDKKADIPAPVATATPVESAPSADLQPDIKPAKKSRKKPNTVSLEVEPEIVSKPLSDPDKAKDQYLAPPVICLDCKTPLSGHKMANSVLYCPTPTSSSAQPLPTPAPQPQVDIPVAPVAGEPSPEQMLEYRKKIQVFTQQLPATPGLGSVQRMRAFITKMSDGVAPQNMNVVQWEKVIAWFDDFAGRNGVPQLLTYIGDVLGDVKKG